MSTRTKIVMAFGLIVLFCVFGTHVIFNSRKLTGSVRSVFEQMYENQDIYGNSSGLISKLMVRNESDEKGLNEEKDRCHPDYFKNALLLGRHRKKKGFLTIGIPSMKRPQNQTYLYQTLDSLLNNSNGQEQNETVIVIFLSDMEQEKRNHQAELISTRYHDQIDSGLIQVIEAPKEFYPSFDNLKRTYRHHILKVKWRSKQNIDYAFMMKYSQNISEYYLQLEDDVLTVPRYMDKIKHYMKAFKVWTCLEYSSLGFIAKLYHSYDLKQLSDMLILFYNEQPNDFTYLHFNAMQTQFRRFILKPTIFQHFGYHSTLSIKKEPRKDPLFKDTSLPNEKASNKPTKNKVNPK